MDSMVILVYYGDLVYFCFIIKLKIRIIDSFIVLHKSICHAYKNININLRRGKIV